MNSQQFGALLAVLIGTVQASQVHLGPCLTNGQCYDIGEGSSVTVNTRVDISYINAIYYSSGVANNDINRVETWWLDWFARNKRKHV